MNFQIVLIRKTKKIKTKKRLDLITESKKNIGKTTLLFSIIP